MIGQRYELLEKLGEGGMGVVYKAQDRLQNQVVALKRVTTMSTKLQFAERSQSQYTADMALAHEFRTLASLRHPHIISVLDYGFDDAHKPYFTMEYLDNAMTYLDALEGASVQDRLTLTIQMLHALAYLHRRGLLHRDLKPENVLVTHNFTKEVKVLDFGLANEIPKNHEDTSIMGTIHYMAPEVFSGGLPGIAADLYAVGVMLYEVFHQQHPFLSDSVTELIHNLMFTTPEVTEPHDIEEVKLSIDRLLSKAPQDRYQNASELIRLYADVVDEPALADNQSFRESFLQAARFIGRERELDILRTALQQVIAKEPVGQAILIGGESGVGKSRLVEELRTIALVQGTWVIIGEGVEGGGLPYQLWRNVARRLVLSTQVSDGEASILKELVPDIDNLLGRAVADAPSLSGKAAVERISLTLLELFRKQTKPIVLILSDLHWTSTSLHPLNYLLPAIETLPLMIVGSYRSDERPDLPETLASMQLMQLDRLKQDEIEKLGQSMLGEAMPDAVLTMIQEYSEGNALFIIEVVRALADHAGQLHNIGLLTLPDSIVTGGIEAIIQRRLQRVDSHYHEALKLAAVAGRMLDSKVLKYVLSDDLDANFYQVCADAWVLEMYDEQWRFTHGKLRTALLDMLSIQELQTMNARVAVAIEKAYPQDEAQAHILAQHYLIAQDHSKAIEYGLLAAQQMVNTSTYRDAVDLLHQVLALLRDDSEFASQRMVISYRLGNYYEHLSAYDVAQNYFEDSFSLARTADNQHYIAQNLTGLGILAYDQSDNELALSYLNQGLDIARDVDDKELITHTLKNRSNVYSVDGDYQQSDADLHEALAINREANLEQPIADCLNNLGVNAYLRGDYAAAKSYYQQALDIYRTLGYRSGIALCESNLGDVSYDEGDAIQLAHYQRGLKIYREVGNQWGIALCLDNMGSTYMVMGDYLAANECFNESQAISRKINDQYSVMHCLGNLAMLRYLEEDYSDALTFTKQCHDIAIQLDDQEILATNYLQQALIQMALTDLSQAKDALYHACEMAAQAQSNPVILAVLVGIAHLYYHLGNTEQAKDLVHFLLARNDIEDTNRRLFLLPLKGKLGIENALDTSRSLESIWEQYRTAI